MSSSANCFVFFLSYLEYPNANLPAFWGHVLKRMWWFILTICMFLQLLWWNPGEETRTDLHIFNKLSREEYYICFGSGESPQVSGWTWASLWLLSSDSTFWISWSGPLWPPLCGENYFKTTVLEFTLKKKTKQLCFWTLSAVIHNQTAALSRVE